MSRRGAERGSGSVWVAALAGLLAVVGAATVLVGAAAVARHRAASAADLAALAGARSAVIGDPAACTVAQRVAERNGARVTGCRVREGAVVEVTVAVPVRLGGLATRQATARARAGPALPGTGIRRNVLPAHSQLFPRNPVRPYGALRPGQRRGPP